MFLKHGRRGRRGEGWWRGGEARRGGGKTKGEGKGPYMGHKAYNIYYLTLYRKSLLTLALVDFSEKTHMYSIPWVLEYL